MFNLSISDETLIFILLFSMFFVLLYVVMSIYMRSKQFEERLSQTTDTPVAGSREEISLFKKRKESVIDRKIDEYFKRVRSSKRLHFLNAMKENPYFLKILIAMIPVYFLLYFGVGAFLKQEMFVTGSLSLVVTIIFGHKVFNFFESRRRGAFLKVFPHALDIITRGLRAGLSIEKTFETIARELSGPVGEEFRSICEQMQFGIPYEKALLDSSIRVRIQDYSFFTSALIIQKTIGGSLAGFMENVSSIVRRRDELRLKIQSLSAEAKTTGIIIGSLPFITLAAIAYFRPEHIEMFQTDPTGRKVIVIAVSMILGAVVIVNRLTSIDIQ